MNLYLFSYGTLQKESVQKKLFGRTLQGQSDTLHGYKIATIEIRDKTFLARGEDKLQRTLVQTNNDDKVDGTVLELTEEELSLADTYEPDNYNRITVTLASGKKAWLYLAAEPAE